MVFPFDPPEATFSRALFTSSREYISSIDASIFLSPNQFSHAVHAVFQCQIFQLLFRLLLNLPEGICQNRPDMSADDTFIIRILMKVKYMNLLGFIDRPVDIIQGKFLRRYSQRKSTGSLPACYDLFFPQQTCDLKPVKNNMYRGSFRRKQALGNPVEGVAFRYLP